MEQALFSLIKDVGIGATVLFLFVNFMSRFLLAMQTARLETAKAEASRISADAQTVSNVSQMALLGQQQNTALNEKLEAALRLITKSSVEVEHLTHEVERLNNRVEDLERLNSSKQAEINDLQRQVADLQAQLIQVNDELESERRANDALQMLVKQVQSERDSLAAQMTSLSRQLTRLVERLKRLDTGTLQELSDEMEREPVEPKESIP
jgi:chromosome segregation ATPase